MSKEDIEAEGWDLILNGFGFWLFKLCDYRIQYLYGKDVMYVSEKNELGAFDVIYKGKVPDRDTFRLIMKLLMIEEE